MSAIQSDDEFRPIFSRGPLLVIKLTVLAALSCGLMYYDRHSDLPDPLRDALAVTLMPVHWVSSIPRQVQDLGEHLQSRETLIAENDDLRHEHLRLNARLQKLVALEAENRRIRSLLDAAKQIHDAVMIAEIQDVSLDPYRQRLRIDKGAQDGIENGQALIDAHGIMGQVIEVTPYNATAVLITDENQGVPVEVNRNGLQTVAHGDGSRQLTLPFLPTNSDIEVGDLLVSSGLGERYPAGYPVAVVESIERQPGEHFLHIKAVPAARIMQGRQLLLVRQGVPVADTAELIDPDAEPDRVAARTDTEQP